MTPRPLALGDAETRHDVTPALMYRIAPVGIAGKAMKARADELKPDDRWNVISYINACRAPAIGAPRDGMYAQRCSGWHGVDRAFFFSRSRRHTRYIGDWSSDVCSSDLHPDITASYAWVEVRLTNHAAKGVTDKDFELAKKIEEVVGWRPREGSALEGTPNDDQRFRDRKSVV